MNDAKTPIVYRRVTVEGPATVSGLLDAVAQISAIAPQSAEIVQVAQLYGCPLDEDEDAPEDHECEPEMCLSYTVEWSKEDEEGTDERQ